MAAVTIRNLTEETHRAIKALAKQHGRSTEAEIRFILEEATRPQNRIKVGTELANFAKQFGGLDLEMTRDASPIEPASFD